MPNVKISGIRKQFDGVTALSNVSLEVDDGEFMVLLGPSGCGKTTLLRCIAGLEDPNGGSIDIGGMTAYSSASGISLSPRDRRIGMVFQNYALYPHMTVYRNVAFGLQMRKLGRQDIARRVYNALEMVDLRGFETRSPKTLSGGQRQRVAVARTLVTEPGVLLFDEPLSNLDPKLRVALRAQLRRIHDKIGATTIFVTHDQNEAMVLGDRIAVLQDGVISQVAPPREVYHFPATVKVAEFTGNPRTNLIHGQIHRADDRVLLIPTDDPYCFVEIPESCGHLSGKEVVLNCRPEDVEVHLNPSADEGRLEVITVLPDGGHAYVQLKMGDTLHQIIARVRAMYGTGLARGTPVGLKIVRGTIYEAATEMLVDAFGQLDVPASRVSSG